MSLCYYLHIMKQNTLKNSRVIAIVGATASGKTSYSIELAKKINGEIISADSRLVYRGFDIGTAKPYIEERCDIPHHMIDIVEPEFEYSAGLYKTQAEIIIEDIIKREKTPIVVGGTGLYIDILLKNFTLPKVEPDKILRSKLSKLKNEELYNILLNLDNNASDVIDKNDRKKIIRSIEILKATNQSLKEARGIGEKPYEVEWIGKNFERKTLYERIDKRTEQMIENGLIEETKNLLKKHGRIPNLTDTIGYCEIIKYLDGDITLNDAVNLLKQNTRRYAKRQLTWFRKNPEIKWDIYPSKLEK